MHRLLLYSGIHLLIFCCVIRGRPIMLSVDVGPGINISNEDTFSDNDENIDVKLDSQSMIGITQYTNKRQNEEYNLDSRVGFAGIAHGVNSSLTPEYMLELYDKLSKSSPAAQTSNIVRSFKNIPHAEENSTGNSANFRNYRVHSLVFDISVLELTESINAAELRLYTLIQRDQRSYMGVNRVVSIYEILDVGKMTDSDRTKYKHITSKFIYGIENAWESFDVTNALKRSMQEGLRMERFEVRIQTLLMDTGKDNMDINADPNDKKQPLLVVYSNDNSIEHEHNVETHDLLMHGLSSSASGSHFTPSGKRPGTVYGYNEQNMIHSRNKRSRGQYKSSICKRRPLFVNFEDIGWHTWIIAPRGFQAYQCAGKCTFPLSDHLSPSKHAVIQTLMHTIHPKGLRGPAVSLQSWTLFQYSISTNMVL